jgi:hypothetical protein
LTLARRNAGIELAQACKRVGEPPGERAYYDDQSNPSTVPGIYTKLLDVDKVDLIIGAYATAQLAPAMPIVISKNKVFIGLLGLAVNSEFKYPNYFAMIPAGPDAKPAFYRHNHRCAVLAEPQPLESASVFDLDQGHCRRNCQSDHLAFGAQGVALPAPSTEKILITYP